MNIDEDTCKWLGCPTPLEMYKHQCALLEDELTETQALLRKSRLNIAGLVQMNDVLATGKACAEEALKVARQELEELKQAGSPTQHTQHQARGRTARLPSQGESTIAGRAEEDYRATALT